ncbi:MAG: hypothetical protein ACP5IZ_06835 [Thermoprotei archaeon]|jgi:hypothetical protein
MIASYHYVEDGYTAHGEKIPDIPIVYLTIETDKYRARGPAIIDTGFDGGIYPNMEIIKMFKGVKPITKVLFENPLYGASEFEVYTAKALLYYNGDEVNLGDIRVYIPTEPELITGEVLVGREILNDKIRLLIMDNQKRQISLEL